MAVTSTLDEKKRSRTTRSNHSSVYNPVVEKVTKKGKEKEVIH